MNGPLEGLRVVDFSKFLPGPYCTWLLADLGAEVIRIENPRELAKQRKVFGWDKLSEQENARLRAHDIFARGKQSLLLDPGNEVCREAIHQLIASADILVEDYRSGVMDGMGYGYREMQVLNPRLIYCSVTLCGQTGPYARKPGHDPVALAVAGALSRMGEDPVKPAFAGVPVADLLTGSNAAIGVLSAVIARATSGKGQQVDIAMSDSSMALIANVLSRHPDLAKAPAKGTRRADCGIWQTRDGRFIVTTDMEPRYWRRFCDAIGRADLGDRQFDKDHWPQIKADIATIMASRTQAEWLVILEKADTQFAPVLSVAEALENEHNQSRGMVVDLELENGESIRQLGSPIHLSDTPGVAPQPAASPGSATRSVLEKLGVNEKQITAILKESL